ncbi:hypothetical protein DMR96_12435 [Klebsiella pneumoniae]|nr:hypothetical protein DMR96_12435 [Klebsiella pneumoniae]
MASHSVKPKFSRYTQFQPDFIVISVSDARCRNPLVMAPITPHTSSCMRVGFPRSPQSLT